MDARTLKHLERLFIAEINGDDVQLHRKTADRLEREGLIVKDIRSERAGPLLYTVEFHRLTHAGRYAYCATCDDAEEPESEQAQS